MYLAWYGFGRMFIEGLRTDSLYVGDTGIRISQVVGFVTFVVGLTLMIINLVKAKKSGTALPGPYLNETVDESYGLSPVEAAESETAEEVKSEDVDDG